jgi:nitrite reductase/ring-hydroxylating ferredoxin subunit
LVVRERGEEFSSAQTSVLRGCKVVAGADRPIAVFVDAGVIRPVYNRCPHMGFPLDRGTVKDGILTCHWHEARFDLASGRTFDLWADDCRFRTLE